jgi:hypothetical protein
MMVLPLFGGGFLVASTAMRSSIKNILSSLFCISFLTLSILTVVRRFFCLLEMFVENGIFLFVELKAESIKLKEILFRFSLERMNGCDCIFCKIVSGEIPSVKIWEDEDFLATLDIFPNTK